MQCPYQSRQSWYACKSAPSSPSSLVLPTRLQCSGCHRSTVSPKSSSEEISILTRWHPDRHCGRVCFVRERETYIVSGVCRRGIARNAPTQGQVSSRGREAGKNMSFFPQSLVINIGSPAYAHISPASPSAFRRSSPRVRRVRRSSWKTRALLPRFSRFASSGRIGRRLRTAQRPSGHRAKPSGHRTFQSA